MKRHTIQAKSFAEWERSAYKCYGKSAVLCNDFVMPALNAASEGIQKLYHYERFCPKYLADTLTMQRIHFSNPASFNDPWDCYPCFDTTQAESADYRARCITVIGQCPLPRLSETNRHEYERALHANRNLFVEMLNGEFRDTLRSSLVSSWRIYCLAQKATVPLMWSHYGDHHRGICLEFDTDEPTFGSAFKVIYEEKLPALDICNMRPQSTLDILVTKSPDWSYEKE